MYKLKRKRKTLLISSIILVVAVIVAVLLSSNSSLVNSSIIGKKLSANDTATSAGEFVLTADQLIANRTDSASISQNTQYLQSLVDTASNSGGGIVHIPAGTYYFGTAGKSTNGAQDYVILCKNNVTVEGEGSSTVLKPYGRTDTGLDMFYFNEYADSNFTNPEYLVNADFKSFTIDGSDANCNTYTTAGKGFMINLYKDCDWENVLVMYTDGTGFGMDCPINCSIVDCVAIGCGKAATTTQKGASGFGIGIGYSTDESIVIEDCVARDNKKYGIFFEHQGRFNTSRYAAQSAKGFVVRNCETSGNMYDFGGEYANNVTYENCTSKGESSSQSYIHCDSNSRYINIINCDVQFEFADVTEQSEYYYEPIYWALDNGITDGVNRTDFGVDQKMERGQVIVALWRMAGRPGVHFLDNQGNIFDDVSIDSEYGAATAWASARGVDIIPSSGSFYPDEGCARGDFITFLWKYAGSPDVGSDSEYSDVESGTELAKAVNWAASKEITNGMNGAFGTNNIVEREDVVTFLYRYSQSQSTRFNIQYDLQGGRANGNPASYMSGSTASVSNVPSRTGYYFEGWTGSNGNTPERIVRITSSDRGNKVYTANWRRNTYTVNFDANGGNGNMNDLHAEYDVLNALPTNTFAKTGAKFVGWNTSPDGSGQSFEDRARVWNWSATDGDIITLYAQWENESGFNTTFKVEHYKEQLDGQYKLEETDNYEGVSGTETTPDRKTYQGFTSPEGQTVTIEADGSTVVQYYYTRNSYNVTINKGTGIESVTGDGTYKFDQSVTVSAITSEGYENPTWLLMGTPIQSTFLMPAGDIELDVSAELVKYPITYNLDGGEMASNPSEYTIEDEVTLREPIKPGYDFVGWTGSNGTTPQKEVTIPKGSTGEKTYTANWVQDPDVDMEVVIKYSIASPTRDNVTVTIKANVPINVPSGWQRGADEYTITREYQQNVNEAVTITSADGTMSIQANVRIENIDKTAPKVDVSYDYVVAEKKVIVTLTVDEDVQDIAGWNKQDNRTFTKEYTANTEETVVVRDLVGNETQAQIKVDQITSGEDPDNPGEDPDNPGEDPDNPGEDPDNPGEDPDNPGEDPDNPGENPDNPGEDPDNPGEDPDNPGEDPDNPGEDPDNPGEDPDNPGEDPDNPGEDPSNPGEDPDNPGEDPSNPGEDQNDNNNNNPGNNNNNSNNGNTHLINTDKADDKTTANSIIPQTGSNILFIILPIIAVAIIGAVAFIKLRKFKDVR